MTHTWKAVGSQGWWVHHSSGGSGSDSIGVGQGEDVLGPFSSHKLAVKVADALSNAYLAGQRSVPGNSEYWDDYDHAEDDGYEDVRDERFTRGPEPPAATDR